MERQQFYFAYASLIDRRRFDVYGLSPRFYSVARLDGHRLEFDGWSAEWNGAKATAVKSSPTDHVWGVVWTLRPEDMDILDEKEGVTEGVFKAADVKVTTTNNEILHCKAYVMAERGKQSGKPSQNYLHVILRGAADHNLPQSYVDFLRSVEHN